MHPTLRILALIFLAIVSQRLPVGALAIMFMVIIGVGWHWYRPALLRMIRRSRWLLLTMMLIFSYTTPGEFVHGWPAEVSPTYEGLLAGTLQVLRLLTMLAGLVILLGTTARAELMAGIFSLLKPFRYFGLSAERVTARLWLTLHYVEEASPVRKSRWSMLESLEDDLPPAHPVQLHIRVFTWRDRMIAMCMCLGLMVLLR